VARRRKDGTFHRSQFLYLAGQRSPQKDYSRPEGCTAFAGFGVLAWHWLTVRPPRATKRIELLDQRCGGTCGQVVRSSLGVERVDDFFGCLHFDQISWAKSSRSRPHGSSQRVLSIATHLSSDRPGQWQNFEPNQNGACVK
jgi:hypothetical protein